MGYQWGCVNTEPGLAFFVVYLWGEEIISSSLMVTLPASFWGGLIWIMKRLALTFWRRACVKVVLRCLHESQDEFWIAWAPDQPPEFILSEVPWSFFPGDNKGSLFIGFSCYEVTIFGSEAVAPSYTFLCGHNLVSHSTRSAAGQDTGPAEIFL